MNGYVIVYGIVFGMIGKSLNGNGRILFGWEWCMRLFMFGVEVGWVVGVLCKVWFLVLLLLLNDWKWEGIYWW